MRGELKNLIKPGTRLSQKVAFAGFWASIWRIAARSITFIRIIVLARLLAPGDFGLMGIALLIMGFLETFSQTGFNSALVQKSGNIRSYLDTAWSIAIVRGLILGGILIAVAPLVASFFDTPAAKEIIQVLAAAIIIKGLENVGMVYLTKELQFRRLFVYQMVGGVVELGTAIAAALILRNAWALVYGLLAGYMVKTVLSYILHPYRPRPKLVVERIKELYGFGKWVFVSSMFVYLLQHGADFLVGKILGAVALGFYQMAYRISNLAATEITKVVNRVSFPAFSLLQEDKKRLLEAYSKTVYGITFASMPIAAGVAFLAPDLIRVLLGQKWMEIVPAVQILALWGVLRSLSAASGPLFLGIGRPDISTRLQFAKLIAIACIVYPFTVQWGIVGTSLSMALVALFIDPLSMHICISKIEGNFRFLGKAVGFPLVNSGFMVAFLWVTRYLMGDVINISHIVLLILLGASCYLGATFLCGRFMGYDLKEVIGSMLQSGVIRQPASRSSDV
jgi:O-antigen/teichoic acid export membrane protein